MVNTMKTLQNNFTTPEQSKRLLELGVPEWTADCVLENLDTVENDFAAKDYTRWFIEERHVKADIFTENNKGIFLPCWSVGRLMEIYLTCAMDYHPYDDFYTETPSLHFMAFEKDRLIDEIIELFKQDKMDFSKLEE